MSTHRQPDLGPDAWGIHTTWIDAKNQPSDVAPENVERLRAAMGKPPADLEARAPVVTRPGRSLGLGRVKVACEDGQSRSLDDVIPDDFPLGYHRLLEQSGRERRLIVSPGTCWLPDGWRAWGLTVQLYAARSRRSWGIGDLGDLSTLRRWSEDNGAEFLLVSPLHAVAPTSPQEASPYLPATRRFRNPLYVCVPDVSGADTLDADLSARAEALNASPLIDRDAIWELKRAALWQLFGRNESDGFSEWRAGQGSSLQDFAVWSVLAHEHGPDFRDWADPLQDPRSDEVVAFAAEHEAEVDFAAWLQWLLDGQLATACGQVKVLQDLPIGVDGGGADAWAWQDVLAEGVAVGAPPDLFSSVGQNWGSPPFVPWRLREHDYQPFIESIRATMAKAGGLRIDHVMGLFRLWWVPPGGVPTDGAYIRYPSDDLLDIVALESHRAQAIVVGEDLGTVEEGVRETLAERNVLSYRLLWFQASEPAFWPVPAMAAITTHDLPTVAGLWSGADVEDARAYTSESGDVLTQNRQTLLASLVESAGLAQDATDSEAVLAAHRLLGQAPSILVSATLDDAMAVRKRPNMPGTPTRPNWCLPLPVPIDDLFLQATARGLADLLRDAVG